MSDFKKELIEGQVSIVEAYERALQEAPFEFKNIVQEVLTVQKSIARKLGYRATAETNNSAPPPKDYFKNTKKNNGEIPISSIENKDINKDLFKKSNDAPTLEAETIKNENINTTAFKESEEVIETKAKKKAHPQRLNQTQKADIKRLASEGLNAKEISDNLLIVQSKVEGMLKSLSKGKGNLIATNTKKSLQDEIKDRKE